jgi:tripartite-type tricarboxylate transporter receptor subunit TctC
MSAALLAGIAPASAQTYPNRPLRFIVPFSPGGSTDTLARTLGQKLGDAFGQQIVVDNRAGGGGNIGTEMVARAPADGYTILLGYIANLAMEPGVNPNLPFDPVRDFAPISLVATSPNIFVAHPSVPAKTIKEFIAYAKANPRKITFATASMAVVLTGELLNNAAGIQMQSVPYKGTGQAVIDLLGGQVHTMFSGMSSVLPHVKSGRLRPLAVTGAQRWPAVPDVPTVAESGFPGFEASVWFGVLAPARTPKPIITRLNQEIIKALSLPDVRERLSNVGFEIVGKSPEAFSAYIKSEVTKWAKVAKASGVKPE